MRGTRYRIYSIDVPNLPAELIVNETADADLILSAWRDRVTAVVNAPTLQRKLRMTMADPGGRSTAYQPEFQIAERTVDYVPTRPGTR